jgi:putative AdoMet-dependent methyltransferase
MTEARFNDLFDEWANDYDGAVAGLHPEYREVFQGYEGILERVVGELALPSGARILEIGVGTGNLTRLLLDAGYDVVGVEPSAQMRQRAAAKLPTLTLFEGHFLQLPAADHSMEGVVSTYAFHHLTDSEKKEALARLYQIVKKDGKLVFADTVFKDAIAKRDLQTEAKERDFLQLAEDLEREYYPLLDTMKQLFRDTGWKARFEQMNRYVWLMTAVK